MRLASLSLLLLGPALLLAAAAPQRPQLVGPACDDVHPLEPVLVYDATGSTFTGALRHVNLVVYNSGFASLARRETLPDLEGADVAHAGPAAAAQLRADLLQAGAAALCDQELSASETPLRTITLLRGRTEARAHTFSYFLPEGTPYGGVQAVVDDFLATHFPGSAGGSSR